MREAGYALKAFKLVDQFPHTAHVEAVSLLEFDPFAASSGRNGRNCHSMSAQSNPSGETVILDAERIERCIQRIARQILEDHHTAPLIAITAIDGQGTVMARRLVDALEAITQTPRSGIHRVP